jgi:hypothetical protein
MDDFLNVEAEMGEVVDLGSARYFCAWVEDWEVEAIKKQDPVNETRLLATYGGLQWRDPDNGYKKLIAGKDEVSWTKPTKKNGGGYGIFVFDKRYCEDDPNNNLHVEVCLITIDLIECIAQFSQMN